MVFCNFHLRALALTTRTGHNPYFNRWFSAINYRIIKTKDYVDVTILILIDGFLQSPYNNYNEFIKCSHNPYFNRWFSAISESTIKGTSYESHNPYFNRWFSAIQVHR